MVLMEKAEKLKCEEYEMYQINLYCIVLSTEDMIYDCYS